MSPEIKKGWILIEKRNNLHDLKHRNEGPTRDNSSSTESNKSGHIAIMS